MSTQWREDRRVDNSTNYVALLYNSLFFDKRQPLGLPVHQYSFPRVSNQVVTRSFSAITRLCESMILSFCSIAENQRQWQTQEEEKDERNKTEERMKKWYSWCITINGAHQSSHQLKIDLVNSSSSWSPLRPQNIYRLLCDCCLHCSFWNHILTFLIFVQ